MYAAVREYKFDPKDTAEIDRKVQEILVPQLKKLPGFVDYYWIDTGDGSGASMTICKEEAGVKESIRVAAEFVQRELPSKIGKPVVIQGEVKAASQLQRV
ncbi:MAG: hypothetical protein DLM53_09020 [Candidatus Eremiobacter antarcticus]|nr:hypothetical protein [Candidatus Eremiobacteraeota bacterium]MBC5807588.1 hypothetical protein [Candidatus Eremiobacteraeota bacterium]PZR61361.1 MAG: hypothetical protein DLM53_09020 [Candidatus Eremiobacter sp. RRmetagenome_bin22]